MLKYQVTAPVTPGSKPTGVGFADTLRGARALSKPFKSRRDLRGQDVRIERADGQLVEYAGPAR
jgi:hypothetical protein